MNSHIKLRIVLISHLFFISQVFLNEKTTLYKVLRKMMKQQIWFFARAFTVVNKAFFKCECSPKDCMTMIAPFAATS